MRIFVDSFPTFIRNSKFLFNITKFIFGIPKDLFSFREKYELGQIKDLSKLYSPKSHQNLKRISKHTDVNSFHIRHIQKLYKSKTPNSILDVGCGTGYLLHKLNLINPPQRILGLDFKVPNKKYNNIKFIEGDILINLKNILDSSYEFVICTHVIEHLMQPYEVLKELRRVCSGLLIIICPIENKYKWGMNYHINFYPTKKEFIDFLQGNKSSIQNKDFLYKTYFRLGDLMYIEKISKQINN